MNTRRYPRTLQEAFGPYADSHIEEPAPPRDYSAAWWAAMCICAVAATIVIATTSGAPQ